MKKMVLSIYFLFFLSPPECHSSYLLYGGLTRNACAPIGSALFDPAKDNFLMLAVATPETWAANLEMSKSTISSSTVNNKSDNLQGSIQD